MSLVTRPNDLHRPQRTVAIREVVTNLAGATTPPTEKDLHFPLTQEGTELLAAAINDVDSSGEPAVTAKDLHDPWSGATVRRLALFT